MAETKCPLCGSESFFLKNTEDEYEIYEFDLKDGDIVFNSEGEDSELPDITGEIETYCNRCAWHDKLKTLKKG